MSDPQTHFLDLGADYYDRKVSTGAQRRNHVKALEALGYTVTIEPAA
ncbi:hypothetical protein [Ornithinimicrobium cryptoxanthini]|nr:hypothetical protein [Ornithinimicrobium cryptoxanthini]